MIGQLGVSSGRRVFPHSDPGLTVKMLKHDVHWLASGVNLGHGHHSARVSKGQTQSRVRASHTHIHTLSRLADCVAVIYLFQALSLEEQGKCN